MADKVEFKSAAAAAAAAAASKPSEKRSTAIDLIIGKSVKADQFQHNFIHSTDPRLFPWQSSSNACLVLSYLLVLFVSAGSSSPYSYGYSIMALIIDRIRDAVDSIDKKDADDVIDAKILKLKSMTCSLEEMKKSLLKNGTVSEQDFPDNEETFDLTKMLGKVRLGLQLYAEDAEDLDDKAKREKVDLIIKTAVDHFPTVPKAPTVIRHEALNLASVEISYGCAGVGEGEFREESADGTTRKFTVNGHKDLKAIMSAAFASKPPGMVVVRYMSATTDDHDYNKGVLKLSKETTHGERRPQWNTRKRLPLSDAGTKHDAAVKIE